ncbi:hypothetical protein L207DRAFT_599192, partial [Hyaloscypha variabilis F]
CIKPYPQSLFPKTSNHLHCQFINHSRPQKSSTKLRMRVHNIVLCLAVGGFAPLIGAFPLMLTVETREKTGVMEGKMTTMMMIRNTRRMKKMMIMRTMTMRIVTTKMKTPGLRNTRPRRGTKS